MPVKSILDEKVNLDILKDCYLVKKMSTTEISKLSENLFGQKISGAPIYNALIRNNIKVRSKSESISIASSTLNPNQKFLNKRTIEWIDGFLLGDGSIGFRHDETYMGSRFSIGSSQQQWAEFSMSGLKNYSPSEPSTSGKVRVKAPNPIWSSSTLTHPDIISQARRWYPVSNNYKKRIPVDVKITPISVLLWYLGDGSITKYGVSYVIRIATCSFYPEDIENILIPKLKDIGIEACRTEDKNDVKISTNSVGDFFDFIGKKSPIPCYNYKFEYAPWLNLYRISDIVRNDQEKWRVQYLFKQGKLDCEKSPGNKLILFNEVQKNKLLEILNCHTPHEEYANVEVKKEEPNLISLSKVIKNDTERWNARYMITRGIVTCEKKSKLTPDQASVLREKLDLYKDSSAIPGHIVDYEFRKFRQIGFPYYDFTKEYLNQKIKVLQHHRPEINNGLYIWDGYGTELASFFHPHMFNCSKKDKMSAINFFNSDEDFRRGIKKLIALYPKIKESNIREICCNETASSRINNFPPRVMMSILNHLYKGQSIVMLDPCTGFSGRLIGSYASGIVKKYIGIDLSEKTYNGVCKTAEWISSFSNNFSTQLIFGNCIDEMKKLEEKVDFVFTSPPFLNEEIYDGVSVETDYNVWKDIFVRPFIQNSYYTLKVGGKLSVYTEAIRRNDFPKDFCNIAKEIGFVQCDDINFKMPSRENLRKDKTHRIVKVIVFEKL